MQTPWTTERIAIRARAARARRASALLVVSVAAALATSLRMRAAVARRRAAWAGASGDAAAARLLAEATRTLATAVRHLSPAGHGTTLDEALGRTVRWAVATHTGPELDALTRGLHHLRGVLHATTGDDAASGTHDPAAAEASDRQGGPPPRPVSPSAHLGAHQAARRGDHFQPPLRR